MQVRGGAIKEFWRFKATALVYRADKMYQQIYLGEIDLLVDF